MDTTSLLESGLWGSMGTRHLHCRAREPEISPLSQTTLAVLSSSNRSWFSSNTRILFSVLYSTEQHVSFCSGNNFFQISPCLRPPLFSVLGNNRKTKVNSISTQILLQETTPKEQQEKLTLHRDRKEIKSGTVFPVGSSFISESSAFRAAEKQHRRD